MKPYCAVRWPIPPPRARPATPVEPTTPPGVGQSVVLGCSVEVEPRRSTLGEGEPRLGIDLDPPHPREVDDEAVVNRAVSGRVVATAANGDLHFVLLGEAQGLGDIFAVRALRDRRRAAGR